MDTSRGPISTLVTQLGVVVPLCVGLPLLEEDGAQSQVEFKGGYL